MANKESKGVLHECFNFCNYPLHASNLSAAITKTSLSDEKVAAYIKWCCVKYTQAVDLSGRCLMHVAATKGRLKLLYFLLNHEDVNINRKDRESMYTVLHRSLFYGQLHCAVRLIQLGANLQQTDLDDLTPLDHIMKDRPRILEYSSKNPCEIYVWGTNTNYNLGIGQNQSRTHPEPLEFFRKEEISIKKVVMSKFHSVYVTSKGSVWSCGYGSGGRLGLDDENAALVPKSIKIRSFSSAELCVSASISTDHSVLLMANGSVWSFGVNAFHQLGHVPPPDKLLSPKAIKSLKGVNVIGISTSKFHTVIWSKTEVYCCGLNGGQLGFLKGIETTVPSPKPVSIIQLNQATIQHAAASEGATVIVNNKGDVYLLSDYKCRKLTSKNRQLESKTLCVVGGHLDHKVNSSSLEEKEGCELKILILTNVGDLFIWQESTPVFTRCLLSIKRHIQITDVTLNRKSLLLCTADGEAFHGQIKAKRRKTSPIDIDKVRSAKPSFAGFLDVDECEHIELRRIPHIHRAVTVASDLNCQNFAVIQTHPKSALITIPFVETTNMKENMKMLLETVSESDSLHDVVFKVEKVTFPAHRFVVSHSSPYLEDLIKKSPKTQNIFSVELRNIHPEIFKRILCYLYTADCDLLHGGKCDISFEEFSRKEKREIENEVVIMDDTISAYEFYKAQKPVKKNPNIKTKDPLRLLCEAAKQFGIIGLQKKLEMTKKRDGCITNTALDELKFDRKRLMYLSDLSLKSEDGTEIRTHKCILVARLEYFNSMLNHGWAEASQKSVLKLSMPGRVLEVFVKFLYTDEAIDINTNEDIDLASLTLIIADEFFCTRLKEQAELCLSNLMNLKNASEMLQLAVTYNASQLKQCVMEFICLNLTALLEARSLEILPDTLLSELKDFYRSWLPCMARRNLTTYEKAPDDDIVDCIYKNEPVALETEAVKKETNHPKLSNKVTKKKRKEKRTSESEEFQNASFSSSFSEDELLIPCDLVDDFKGEEAWVKVVNNPVKLSKKVDVKWKAITDEEKTTPLPSNYTKLNNLEYHSPTKDINEKDKGFLSTSLEKEFPLLNSSPAEQGNTSISPRQRDRSKKFTKLSQKQRKKVASSCTSPNENESTTNIIQSIKSPWCLPEIEQQSLENIMKQESRQISFETSGKSNLPWQNKDPSSLNLTSIMAAERLQRDMATKLKFKSLQYTQIEDRAIEDLLSFYNANNLTEERITVRRADNVFVSPPVWVSSHR